MMVRIWEIEAPACHEDTHEAVLEWEPRLIALA